MKFTVFELAPGGAVRHFELLDSMWILWTSLKLFDNGACKPAPDVIKVMEIASNICTINCWKNAGIPVWCQHWRAALACVNSALEILRGVDHYSMCKKCHG